MTPLPNLQRSAERRSIPNAFDCFIADARFINPKAFELSPATQAKLDAWRAKQLHAPKEDDHTGDVRVRP